MPFGNPIVLGSGELAIPGIRSKNYVESVEGWRVGRDGNAQFSNASIIGDVGVSNLSADTITLDGADLASLLVDSKAKGIIAYDYKTAGTATANIAAATETKLFEFSAGEMFAGRLYRVMIHGFIDGTVATDIATVRVRYTLDGSAPTTSSTGFLKSWDINMDSNANCVFEYIKAFTIPSDTTNCRMCFTMYRSAGSGSVGISYSRPFEWAVEDCGSYADAAAAGTLAQKSYLDATPPDPDPVRTYSMTRNCIWSRSYDSDGSARSPDENTCYQGWISSYHGNTRSLLGFNYADIISDLAGATVNYVKLIVKIQHAYYNAGMNLLVGGHNYTSRPSSWNGANVNEGITTLNDLKSGVTYTKLLSSSFGTNLKSGTWKGIAFGPGPNNHYDYYGYAYGYDQSTVPKLVINYTK